MPRVAARGIPLLGRHSVRDQWVRGDGWGWRQTKEERAAEDVVPFDRLDGPGLQVGAELTRLRRRVGVPLELMDADRRAHEDEGLRGIEVAEVNAHGYVGKSRRRSWVNSVRVG